MSKSKLLTPAQMIDVAKSIIQPTYLCPVCGKAYDNHSEALSCALTSERPVAEPGDLVVISNGYGWHDGLNDWIYDEDGYEFHDKKTLRFWFVVTDVTQKQSAVPCRGSDHAHRLAYHVQTLGLRNGREGGYSGWTAVRTHISFTKPKRKPPASAASTPATRTQTTWPRSSASA